MASPTPPHYSINPPKPHQTPHPSPQNHLQKHPQKHHRTSQRLHSSSSSSSTSLTSTSSGNTVISSGISSITSSTTTTTLSSSKTSPSSSSSQNALTRNPNHPPYYPQPRAQLDPEFRRSRSTRVVSKRNFNQLKPSHGHNRPASTAAKNCLNQIIHFGSDANTLTDTLLGFEPTLVVPNDYYYILHELGDRDKAPHKATGIFQFASRLMRDSTEKGKLLTATISGLGKMGCYDLAKQVFDVGLAEGYGNSVYAYSSLISAYARSGRSTEAMGVFESMKALGLRPNSVSYNAVIDACGKGGVDLQLTAEFFREMLRDGFRPDRITFNSLLAGCSRTGHWEDARMMFDEMIELGIGRDIYTYNTFIDAVCKGGNMELAVQIMMDMPANNVHPNVVTYSTLMDGYSKLERFDEALSLYGEMRSLRIRLDRVCYNTLLSIYVKNGRYEEIGSVCEEMELTGIEKDTVTYNALITGYGKQRRFDVVSCLIQDMREQGVAPSVLTYSTLIDIYSKAGMFEDAKNAFMEFRKTGMKADVVLYSSFIDTLSKNGLVEWAVLLLDEMTGMGIEPNVVTYNTVIDAFGKSGISVEDSTGREMGNGEGCNQQIVRVCKQLAGGKGQSFVEEARGRSEELFCILGLFQKMIQRGIKPSVVTFSATLNACSRCNSFEDASLLLEQLRLFDHYVYGVAHGLLMGYREVWVQAKLLFDELRRMDPPTSSAFYNALTDMLWHFGQRRGAQQVVLEGVRRQVWDKAWSDFSLDLHLMSSGAAQAMVHAWLLSVRSIVFEGRELPEFLSILTGWGKHSKIVGTGTIRRAIEALLDSIGAPFRLERFNIGRFVSTGALVAAWLRESGTINILLLHDKRTQPTSPLNLLPKLQALHL